MIVCPNCQHQNPEGATQCEACYTVLPQTLNCPQCGATVQSDATFCGQCGFSLQPNGASQGSEGAEAGAAIPATKVESEEATQPPNPNPNPNIVLEKENEAAVATPTPQPQATPTPAATPAAATQLQVQKAKLLHLQTNKEIELPENLAVIHFGKPGGAIPPDIDVSGFPDSAIVSRVHADIRVEGDAFYIEDVGSSNGTYINHSPLLPGNRHKLRNGDRIALGKEDKVTFIFQST